MSFADHEELAAFIGRDHLLPMVTPEAVANALKGFPLTLLPGRDLDWLTTAVRRSLAITVPNISDGPERTSNADIKAALERLAESARSTWLKLSHCEQAVDSRLWHSAFRHWDGEGGADMGHGLIMGVPSGYRRFKAAVVELEWLSSFLRQAALAVERQKGPWKQAEKRELRIQRGRYLAPVFEAAFGELVSANNWPSDARHSERTPFMKFYQGMVEIAFDERATQDLSGVLKDACRLHRKHPAQFEGIIPGL